VVFSHNYGGLKPAVIGLGRPRVPPLKRGAIDAFYHLNHY
jgi:hypothetical protein